MKKIAVLIAIMMIVPAAAFAVNGSQSDTVYTVAATGTNPAWSVSLSKNVSLGYVAEATGLAFTAATVHASGDKKYGSSSGDTKIYNINNTAAALPAAPADALSSADFSGWIAL